MCGIAGGSSLSEKQIENIKLSLLHRGPDEQNIYNYRDFSLIHTRLSIQDVSNGAQPFEIGDYIIAYNGEIYNHLSLRNKVKEYSFKTQCDTETLLALFIEYGESILADMDGMFAFSIFNKAKNEVYLGRDRSGKKPLYYYKKSDLLFFASELNSIKVGVDNLVIDDDEIYSYIRNGFFYKNKTPYQDVFEVDPGYVYKINLNDLSIKKRSFFNYLNYYKKTKISDIDVALEKVDECLHRSIKDRLLSSDLEVGAFLSGGIDSSLIVAIASEYVDKLKTFTVKFEDAYDESELAKLTAQKYKTNHTEIQLSMNLGDDIEDILQRYGEPFMDSSAIPSYYVSLEAKKHLTVVLNGDGADELFGGYRRYVPVGNNLIKLASCLSFLVDYLPTPNTKKSFYNYFFRMLIISNKSGIDYYNSSTNDIFEDVYKFKSNETFDDMHYFIQAINNENISELSKVMFMDFNIILRNDLLKKMDIATMSNSIEGRSPFLSKYLLEWAPKLPDHEKVKGFKTKYILRELASKYSLNHISNQPKSGFEVPLKKWVEIELKDNIYDKLSVNTYSENFVSRKFINKLLHKHSEFPSEKRAKMLWNLYSLEVWHSHVKKQNSNSLL